MKKEHDQGWDKWVSKAKEMFTKENSICIPVCLGHLSLLQPDKTNESIQIKTTK